MGLAQPSYLIHLQENAPESYRPAQESLIEALKKVKRVVEGEIPEVGREADDEIPF